MEVVITSYIVNKNAARGAVPGTETVEAILIAYAYLWVFKNAVRKKTIFPYIMI